MAILNPAMLRTTTSNKLMLITLLLLICKLGVSQSHHVDSTSLYLERLNWKSFSITTNYVPSLHLSKEANELVSMNDGSKIEKLVKDLSIKDKTVVIHVILSKILEPDKCILKQSYIYDNDSVVIGVKYTYNGLSWVWSERLGHTIPKENVDKIVKYWKVVINNKSKSG